MTIMWWWCDDNVRMGPSKMEWWDRKIVDVEFKISTQKPYLKLLSTTLLLLFPPECDEMIEIITFCSVLLAFNSKIVWEKFTKNPFKNWELCEFRWKLGTKYTILPLIMPLLEEILGVSWGIFWTIWWNNMVWIQQYILTSLIPQSPPS